MISALGLSSNFHVSLARALQNVLLKRVTSLVSPIKKSPRGPLSMTAASSVVSPVAAGPGPSVLPVPAPLPLLSHPITPLGATPVPDPRSLTLSAKPTTQSQATSVITSASSNDKDDFEEGLARLSVLAWKNGYEKIAKLMDDDNISEAIAFPKVFGLRYVKSTACGYKRDWNNAPQDFRDAFLQLGNTKKASWKRFKTALWKNKLPSYAYQGDSSAAMSTSLPVASTSSMKPSNGAALRSKPFPTEPLSPPQRTTTNLPTIKMEPQELRTMAPANMAPSDEAMVLDSDANCGDLCPFCDEPLPLPLSPRLAAMLEQLKAKTWEVPTEDNPAHREAASFQVFVSFLCSSSPRNQGDSTST